MNEWMDGQISALLKLVSALLRVVNAERGVTLRLAASRPEAPGTLGHTASIGERGICCKQAPPSLLPGNCVLCHTLS